jgi:hypothetical protein
MKIKIVFFVLALFLFSAVDVSACVKCYRESANKLSYWVCKSASSGGNSCATSSNQQDCVMYGICGSGTGLTSALSVDESCSTGTKRVGKITVSQDVIDSVSLQSDMFGRALGLANENDALGAENAVISTTENDVDVQITIEVLYKNKRPVAVNLVRSDNMNSLQLTLVKDFDVSVMDKDSWTVGSWIIS